MEPDGAPLLREIDRQIIGVLRTSARASAHEIARSLDADYRVVRRELAHLLDSGTVRIAALADPGLTGQRSVAYVWLRSRAIVNSLVDHLATAPAVMWGALMVDHARAIAQVSCNSAAELLHVLDVMRSWEGVVDVDAAVVLRSYIGPQVASTALESGRAASQAGTVWLGGEVRGALDETGKRILDLLRVDGRISLTAIADRLDIPLTTARRRLSRLLDVDGVRLQCRVKPEALGYSLHAGVRVRVSHDVAGFARKFSALQPVAWLSETSGSSAVMAEMMTATQDEMDRAIQSMVEDARCRDVRIDYYDPRSVKDTGLW